MKTVNPYAPSEEDRRLVMNFAAQGLTDNLIARNMGLSLDTLMRAHADDIAEGREYDLNLTLGEMRKMQDAPDHSPVKYRATEWRLKHLFRKGDVAAEQAAIHDEAETDAALAALDEKLGRILAMPVSLDTLCKSIKKGIETGHFTGDWRPFANIATPPDMNEHQVQAYLEAPDDPDPETADVDELIDELEEAKRDLEGDGT